MLLGPVQGPFLGEVVQKSPKSKGGERESAGTWLARSGGISAERKIWKGLEPSCFEGGSVQVDKELPCGQQRGARGQGVTFS